MTTFLCWWHRVTLGHPQKIVMNGATEPGVWCACPNGDRWFPSDGGHGR